tara:strand:- start:206 stop:1186 length:981 start_codon:yes stop_codon:yes gene_type:complete
MVEFDKIFSAMKRNIITILVLISIIYSDSQIQKSTFENAYTIIGISILTILFWFKGTLQNYDLKIMLVLYGLYVITIYGYTFYQWNKSSLKTEKECSFSIPRTKNFNDSKYYLYRIIYLTTTIVIITLIQNLLDEGGDLSTWKINPQNFVVMLPILLPILTELINGIVNTVDTNVLNNKNTINPESLLSSFMLGDTKKDIFTSRLIMPVVFYIFMIGYSYYCSYNYKSTTPIYVLLLFIIGFSVWMRTIFVQDCSLAEKKDISKAKDFDLLCIFEKYGGIQALIATCFLVSMLSYVKSPTYKLFIFMIMGLASGLLSTVFILNLKS